MRSLLILALLVPLAGCAQSGPEAAGGEDPLFDGPDNVVRNTTEAVRIDDSGSMEEGVDENWTFQVPANTTRVLIQLLAMPVEGQMVLRDLEAKAFHNGSLREDGSQYMSGSINVPQAKTLVEINARDRNRTGLADLWGDWELVLRGGPQVAEYQAIVVVEAEA